MIIEGIFVLVLIVFAFIALLLVVVEGFPRAARSRIEGRLTLGSAAGTARPGQDQLSDPTEPS